MPSKRRARLESSSQSEDEADVLPDSLVGLTTKRTSALRRSGGKSPEKGVNETAAASNVKMSCGVIIGIIVIAVAVIAHYYPGYKGGGDLIVSADEGEAAEYQGGLMGLYRQLDGSSYQQVGGSNYLYQVLPERVWYISSTLMKKGGAMKNPTGSSSVPASGWKYWGDADDGGDEWRDDPELSVRMLGQELQCNTITITSSRCTRKEVLGDYKRIKNDVLNGRPVFRNAFNQYLRVPTGHTNWMVGPQRDDKAAWLESGRATSCPAHPNSGKSRRDNQKHWQYWDGEKWVEDPTLFVTCNDTGVNETAAASNVKMSCGVIIKIIGIIVIAVIAVIAHYYYKGGGIDTLSSGGLKIALVLQ